MRDKLMLIRKIKKEEKDEEKKIAKLDKLNIKADKVKAKKKQDIIDLVPELLAEKSKDIVNGLSKEDVRSLIREEKESRKQAKLDVKNKKLDDIRRAKELLGIVDEPVVKVKEEKIKTVEKVRETKKVKEVNIDETFKKTDFNTHVQLYNDW